jgi:hypothetical protein
MLVLECFYFLAETPMFLIIFGFVGERERDRVWKEWETGVSVTAASTEKDKNSFFWGQQGHGEQDSHL